MTKRLSFLAIFIICILSSNLVLTVSSEMNIIIDGDLSDWEAIDPLFHEENITFDLFFDIKQGYLTVNETYLFLRIDMEGSYNESPDLVFLYVNVTIQTLSDVFILCMGADYYENQFHSMAHLMPGRGLNSPYHIDPRDDRFTVTTYENVTALDPTNSSIEAAFPLIDLGVEISDKINISYWHFDDFNAATLYDIPLELPYIPSQNTSTTYTSSLSTSISNFSSQYSSITYTLQLITSIAYSYELVFLFFLASVVRRKKQNKVVRK